MKTYHFAQCAPAAVMGADVPPPGTIPSSMAMVTTSGSEVVPILGYNYNKWMLHQGSWSDPATWSGGTVPVATDSVLVQDGGRVVIDSTSCVCKNLIVQGIVFVSRTATTKLLYTTITLIDDGNFDAGTDADKISGFAEVVGRNSALDTVNDPEQFGNGLVLIGGTLTGAGQPKTNYARLGAEIAATNISVTLGSAVSNWRAGDRIVTPDTRQLSPSERGGALGGTFTPQWEEKNISTIAGNNLSLTTSAFSYAHRGCRNRAGTIERYPHIANLTRNVVFRSENVAGVTAHCIVMDTATVFLQDVLFYEMGRTTNADLQAHTITISDPTGGSGSFNAGNAFTATGGKTGTVYVGISGPGTLQYFTTGNTGYLANGDVVTIGSVTATCSGATTPSANHIARYGLHFHHSRGPTGQTGGVPTHTVSNCVFDGGPTAHNLKWGITIHDSSYGLFTGNTIYNWRGAGVMCEQGTEYLNEISNNLVIRATGSGGRPDANNPTILGKGRQGIGYYFRGPYNLVSGNCAVNCHGNVVDGSYGFIFFFGNDGAFVGNNGSVRVPSAPGNDTNVSGQYLTLDANTSNLEQFDNNEVYAGMSALTIWSLGTFGEQPRALAELTTINNFSMWHCWELGFFQYEVNRLTFDGYWVRGDATQVASGDFVAWYGADYLAQDVIVKNIDIQGVNRAFSPSVDGPGPQLYQDGTIYAVDGFVTQTPWDSAARADFMDPKVITIDNIVFDAPSVGGSYTSISRAYVASTGTVGGAGQTENFRIQDDVLVIDYQGVPGDNFQVYYTQQDGSFVMPPTVLHNGSGGPAGTPKVLGSPNPGQTNAQLWASSFISIAGSVAPAGAAAKAHVFGLCFP